MTKVKSISEYKKLVLMTSGLHSLLDGTFQIVPDEYLKKGVPPINMQNALLVSQATPMIRRIAMHPGFYDQEQTNTLIDFLNYLEALLDQFNEKPWEDQDGGE